MEIEEIVNNIKLDLNKNRYFIINYEQSIEYNFEKKDIISRYKTIIDTLSQDYNINFRYELNGHPVKDYRECFAKFSQHLKWKEGISLW